MSAPILLPGEPDQARELADLRDTINAIFSAVGYTEEYARQWPKEKASVTFKRWFDERLAAAPAGVAAPSDALRDVADAVCKQFASAGIAAVIGSPNPAEDLHARAVLALGGKLQREHITSSACWCEPTVEYRDPVTGAAVILHKEIQ